jgi:hypothetical protein
VPDDGVLLHVCCSLKIIMWRASDPNNKRYEDVILRETPEACATQAAGRDRRSLTSRLTSSLVDRTRRAAGQQQVIGSTDKLWPYSKVKVAVAVLNTANSGTESDAIDVDTPEGGQFDLI